MTPHPGERWVHANGSTFAIMLVPFGSAVGEYSGEAIPEGAHEVFQPGPRRSTRTVVMNRRVWQAWSEGARMEER